MRNETWFRLQIPLIIFSACSTPVFAQQPNIIFIYADDWGYGDLSIHGHQTITTPNLDRLAAEGTEFLQFNVCSPVCSSSRTAIMTGLYPSHYQIHQHFADHQLNMDRNMPDWLDPTAPMISRLFKEAGYRTAHYGKWHLTNSGVIDPPLPVNYGYEETYVFNGPGPGVGVPIGVSTGKCVDYCIDFINKDQGKPFFINLWIHESHAAIDPPEDAKEAYAHVEEPFRSYYACISYADRELGRLFKYLKDTGLDASTMIVFSSDNGPEGSSEDPTKLEYYSRGETAGLRGQKRSLYEGGVGLPFIVHWPGTVPAGKINNTSTIAAVDILPSFCQIAGIDLPGDYISDGEDMSASLLGGDQQRSKPIFWDWRGATFGENWPRMAVRSGDWKLLSNEDGSQRNLFNIQSNRVEQYDSLSNYPELADSLFLMVSNWKKSLPTNIPIKNIAFYTNKAGDRVVIDFSNTNSTLNEIMDPEFRVYRSAKNIEIPIDSISHDTRKIYLHLSLDTPLGPEEVLSIAFRSGKVTTKNEACLLFFSIEPVQNQIQLGPDLYSLVFNLFDGSNNFSIPGVTINADTIVTETNLNGGAYFHLPEGNYIYSAVKENYTSVKDTLDLFEDTEINLYLYPTTASVKFRITDGDSPLYQAEVEIGEKKKTTNTVGIAVFDELSIGESYPYSITKTGYFNLKDTLILNGDSTLNAVMLFNTSIIASENEAIRVFPNPVQEKLNIQSSKLLKSVILYDMNGLVVKQSECHSKSCTIEISNIAKGSYMLEVFLENSKKTPTLQRIIIL